LADRSAGQADQSDTIMHRDNLLQLIEEYAENFPNETDVTARLSDFVKENPTCFERELACGHITGSAWLVDLKGKRVLLTHHKKLNGWFQLGGHADGDSDILNVSMTEAREESGIDNLTPVSGKIFDIDIHLIPEHKSVPAHYHYDICFAIQVVDTENYIVSDESNDLAWVATEDMKQYSDTQSMLRMAEKWKNLATSL